MAPLFESAEWTFDGLKKTFDAIEEIAIGEMGLDVFPNQVEVITVEQMLDAYSSIGMPLMYRHWSFGKRFAREQTLYRRGMQALAYEMVINSNPCISYIMEENSMTMQALVLAHAAFGHNHFFKNNYLFRQWTDAEGVLDYLSYAKSCVVRCEELHGVEAVEAVLDSAHALMHQGVYRYAQRDRPNLKNEQQRRVERHAHEESTYSDLWRTVPRTAVDGEEDGTADERRQLGLPEENLLFFLEQHAPKLEDWQRELLQVVRNMAQYFYPQRQTKVMNEGCATFVHYETMNRLYDKGLLTEGTILEFLRSHSTAVMQPDFNDPRYGGLNPYALGFAMMQDIKRICEEPTQEDKDWFPTIAGNGNPLGTLREAWADYRDESFILQFLSPKTIRDFRLFAILDNTQERHYTVRAIHDERGYEAVRRVLARQYDIAYVDPDIQITSVDLKGDRKLVLTHYARDGIVLDKPTCDEVLVHVAQLWGYAVKLLEVERSTGKTLKEHNAVPLP
jgi:spore cortex formation protein SpoVR/YcgB (stage V sporulation)